MIQYLLSRNIMYKNSGVNILALAIEKYRRESVFYLAKRDPKLAMLGNEQGVMSFHNTFNALEFAIRKRAPYSVC